MTTETLNCLKVLMAAKGRVGCAIAAATFLIFPAKSYSQSNWHGYYSSRSGDNSHFSIIGSYRGYTNPNTESGVQGNKISATGDLELGIRLYKIFSVIGVGGESPDQSYTFGGAGFRVDVPGFFLFGASPEDLLHRHRRSPVNTSLHGEITRFAIKAYRDAGLAWQSFAPRGGFTVDVMLPGQDVFFLSADASFFTVNGDAYVSGALGLGLEL